MPRVNTGRRNLSAHGAICALALTFALAVPAGAANPPAKSSLDFKTWTDYLGGPDSSQFSALDQINKDNVAQLKVAWTYPIGDGPASHFNPVVIKNILYFLTPKGDMVALNPATGKELWRKAYGGRVGGRGMNYWESKDGKDRRLIFLKDGKLTAASADTGEIITSFGDKGGVDIRLGLSGDISKVRPLQTDNPGRIYKDIIIFSLPAGAYDYASAAADIHAYDVKTGKLLWVFHTVPQKGEFGYDTWPEKDHDKLGGVHNWSESTLDPDLGIMYIPTGTARYDFYGGNRKGMNLFANSILALDAKTGKRLWHFQTVHHDLWDYDIPVAPKLMTIKKDGKDVPILIQATKQGFVFVLNRLTGEPIWPIEERPVPASDVPGELASPTQPFPTVIAPFSRQGKMTEADINPFIPEKDKEKLRAMLKTARNEGLFTPPSIVGSISLPGHNGGVNFGMSAVDPVNKRFYVISRELPTLDKLTPDTRATALANMPNGGGDVQPYQSPVNFLLQSNGFSAINPPWSTITAYDMNTGATLWQLPNGEVKPLVDLGIKETGSHIGRGSPVVTGGGLVFNATSTDRKFRARDAESGKILWEADLPAASEGVPAVYESGGKQYIVIAVGGDGLWAPKLPMPKAGPNQYIAFALPDGAGEGSAK